MCMFCRSLFVLFLLVIVLSILLWYTDSDYLFVISNFSYWYAGRGRSKETPIKGHMWVTSCHEYIMMRLILQYFVSFSANRISLSIQTSLVTQLLSRKRSLFWILHDRWSVIGFPPDIPRDILVQGSNDWLSLFNFILSFTGPSYM
jgi:hypothetical protein